MGWNNFSPSADKEITEIISDAKLTYDCIDKDLITVDVEVNVQVGEITVPIRGSASKEIRVKAPNLMSHDNKFICSYDSKFIDIQEGDE